MLGEYQYMSATNYINKQCKKKEIEKERKTSKFYSIMNKAGKSLDEITKSDLNKKDYEFIINYVKSIMGCPLSLYPNLQ